MLYEVITEWKMRNLPKTIEKNGITYMLDQDGMYNPNLVITMDTEEQQMMNTPSYNFV